MAGEDWDLQQCREHSSSTTILVQIPTVKHCVRVQMTCSDTAEFENVQDSTERLSTRGKH